MRSCEYLKTPANEEKKTRLLCIRNIEFRNCGTMVPHACKTLRHAKTVTVTFEDQKNGEMFKSITMHRCPPEDPLCPVETWADLVHRVLSYPGTNEDTPVCTYMGDNGRLTQLSSATMLVRLRTAVTMVGEDRLGFKASEVSTHSIRSGAAMAMYLDNVPVFTIMLIGRWKSDAFLNYIRKQVEMFSHNVSTRMLKHLEWYTTPDYQPLQPPPGTSTRDVPRRDNNSPVLDDLLAVWPSHKLSPNRTKRVHGRCATPTPPASVCPSVWGTRYLEHKVPRATPTNLVYHVWICRRTTSY